MVASVRSLRGVLSINHGPSMTNLAATVERRMNAMKQRVRPIRFVRFQAGSTIEFVPVLVVEVPNTAERTCDSDKSGFTFNIP